MKQRILPALFVCCALAFLAPVPARAQWQKLTAPGVTGVDYLLECNNQLFALRVFGGLYHSTDDGQTWQPVAASPLSGDAQYLTMDGDGSLLVVLTLDNTSTLRAFQSTDGAQNWQPLPTFPIPGSGTFSDKVFVRDGNIYYYSVSDYKLYRFDNNSNAWLPLLTISGFLLDFGFDNNTIWAGSNSGLKYSPDRGASWQTVSAPFTKVVSVDVDGNRVVVATDNGIYTSLDYGASWALGTLPQTDLNTRILADEGAFYAVALNGAVYRSTDGFQTWQQVFTGPYGLVQWVANAGWWVLSTEAGFYRSPQDPAAWQWLPSAVTKNENISLQAAGGVLFYTGAQTVYSTDEGNTWQNTKNEQLLAHFLFHNGVWLARESYSDQLRASSNLKDWTLQGGLPPATSFIAGFGATLVSIPYQPSWPVYTSQDNGISWQQQGSLIGDSTIFQSVFVYNNQIYSYQPGDFQRSADFGVSWQPLGSGLAADPNVHSFLTIPGKIYALSNQNLLTSTDGGLSWTLESLSPVNPSQGEISGRLAFNGGLLLKPSDNVLYFTQDDGASWQPVMGGLTAIPTSQIVTTGNSVFVLDNKLSPWRRDNFVVNVAQYSGQVYRDLNTNGLQDAGEPGLPNTIVRLAASNQYVATTASGAFALFAEMQNDQLQAFSPGKYCNFTPANYAVNATNTQLDFGLQCPTGITDLSVNLVNSAPFRPGFDTDLLLSAFNLGVEAATGAVTLTLDPALAFVSATPPATPIGNTLSWSFAGFAALDRLDFSVRVHTPAPTPLGTVLNLSAAVSPNVADHAPADNTQTMSPVVVGSYDPNDKQVDQTAFSPNNLGNGRPLVYTIRFQNTGTYYATTVVVRDTLSANLDPATVQVLGASHPYTWSMRGPGILEFRFDNIYLPDTLSDEAGSHGFVQFAVALRGNLPLGALTQNTGHIYFDFNAPIVTNTVSTALVSTAEPLVAVPLSVFPNPASDRVQVLLPDEKAANVPDWRIFDAAGRLVRILASEEDRLEFRVGDLPAGTYRIWGVAPKVIYTAIFAIVH